MLLNNSSLKTEVKFIETCITRKIIRKKAERAIANFLPTEDLKIPLIVDVIFVLVPQKYCTRHVLATEVNHNYLFRMILIKSQIFDF